jgi:hypothetical protein
MLLDDLVPEFDTTRVEHRVIEGGQDAVYDAVLAADFMRAWRESAAVRLLFAARGSAERVVSSVRGRPFAEPPAPDALRLVDLPERGEWVKLGEDAPHEIAFGAVG